MDRLFDFATANVSMPADKAKPSIDKLDGLERELRDATMESREEMTSQMNGAGTGTAEQRSMVERFDPQNKDVNYYGKVLGDYSAILSQMNSDTSSATAAMNLSTKEAKAETTRLSSESFDMLSNQFGLTRQSEDSFKKARKTTLMSSDNWL